MYICKHDFYTCITLEQPVFQRTHFFKGYTAQEKLNEFASQTTFRSKKVKNHERQGTIPLL